MSAIHTLKSKLVEELTVVALICLIFLLHFRSAFVAVFHPPREHSDGVYRHEDPQDQRQHHELKRYCHRHRRHGGTLRWFWWKNAHKHLARDNGEKTHTAVILDSAKEVGPALFYSLLIITVSFVPVFSLTEQSGRMFKPLAYTKTFAMAAAAVLAITIIPVLMTFFCPGRNLFFGNDPQKKGFSSGSLRPQARPSW